MCGPRSCSCAPAPVEWSVVAKALRTGTRLEGYRRRKTGMVFLRVRCGARFRTSPAPPRSGTSSPARSPGTPSRRCSGAIPPSVPSSSRRASPASFDSWTFAPHEVGRIVVRVGRIKKKAACADALTGRPSYLFFEREKGFEPSTSTLARWHSTTELLPRTPRASPSTNTPPM
jgi:hypothetical protein